MRCAWRCGGARAVRRESFGADLFAGKWAGYRSQLSITELTFLFPRNILLSRCFSCGGAAGGGIQGWLRRCPSGMVTADAHRRVHRQRRRRRSMPLVLSVSPFSPCAAATMASRTLLARQAQHIHCVRSLLFLMTHPCSETSTAHETRVTCASQSDCSWSPGSGLFQLRS
jgi:hypothetical protein